MSYEDKISIGCVAFLVAIEKDLLQIQIIQAADNDWNEPNET